MPGRRRPAPPLHLSTALKEGGRTIAAGGYGSRPTIECAALYTHCPAHRRGGGITHILPIIAGSLRETTADEDRSQRHVLRGHVGSDEVSRVVEQARRPRHEARHVPNRMPHNRETGGAVRCQQGI